MKRIFFYSFFTFILILFVSFISCESEINDKKNTNDNLRTEFTKNKSFDKIKLEYNKLSPKLKIELWNEKLEQILQQNIDNTTRDLILNLQMELKQKHVSLERLRYIGVKLSENLSDEEFELMFTTLDDFNYKLVKSKHKSNFFSEQIKNGKMSLINNKPISNSEIEKRFPIDCSCNWTCSTFCTNVTSKCNPTSTGCGFMWAFECEYACAL